MYRLYYTRDSFPEYQQHFFTKYCNKYPNKTPEIFPTLSDVLLLLSELPPGLFSSPSFVKSLGSALTLAAILKHFAIHDICHTSSTYNTH